MREQHSKTAGDVQTAISLVTCAVLMWSHSFQLTAVFFAATQVCVAVAVGAYRWRTKLLQRSNDRSLVRA